MNFFTTMQTICPLDVSVSWLLIHGDRRHRRKSQSFVLLQPEHPRSPLSLFYYIFSQALFGAYVNLFELMMLRVLYDNIYHNSNPRREESCGTCIVTWCGPSELLHLLWRRHWARVNCPSAADSKRANLPISCFRRR